MTLANWLTLNCQSVSSRPATSDPVSVRCWNTVLTSHVRSSSSSGSRSTISRLTNEASDRSGSQT